MEKKQLLKSFITHASPMSVIEAIIRLAHQRYSTYVCIANVHMLVEAWQHPEFNAILNRSEIATPDGKPLSLLMNALYGTQQERIAGPDLMMDLLANAEEYQIGVYFYGGSEATLEKLKAQLKEDFPQLKLAGAYSPPFRPLSLEEDQSIVKTINDSGAGLIFVGLGCPKQERWMADHQGHIQGVMVGVGAAFDFYAGTIARAPLWMQDACLEWLFRLSQEPRRLFKRYFITNSLFCLGAFIQWTDHRLSRLLKPWLKSSTVNRHDDLSSVK